MVFNMRGSTRNSEIAPAHLCKDDGADGLKKLKAGECDMASTLATQDRLDALIGSQRDAQKSGVAPVLQCPQKNKGNKIKAFKSTAGTTSTYQFFLQDIPSFCSSSELNP